MMTMQLDGITSSGDQQNNALTASYNVICVHYIIVGYMSRIVTWYLLVWQVLGSLHIA